MGHTIAIFDYKITPTNPIGGCHLRMLRELCLEHNFTVFAVEFDNPCPERIHWVRIPLPTRPLAFLYLVYHFLAPFYYTTHRLRYRESFDLVQIVESNLSFGDVAYTHFCHRAYLNYHWRQSQPGGLRGWLRWLDHKLHALFEPMVYRRARHIVVPSQGLAQELMNEYPHTSGKIHVLANPVDIDQMRSPEGFDRKDYRRRLGISPEDLTFVFMALGQFERKGLPLLLQAFRDLDDPGLKLLVVGGEESLVKTYQVKVEQMGLGRQVIFAGMQQDVRPFLWSADAFAFPSFYEIFPLVALEAAAAGLPLIVTSLYGVEEIVRDGENGFLVDRTPEGVAQGIRRFLSTPPETRSTIGEQASLDVARYATANFVSHWRAFYRGFRAG